MDVTDAHEKYTTNGTISGLIDESIDLIGVFVQRVVQLIFCLVSVIVIGRLAGRFSAERQAAVIEVAAAAAAEVSPPLVEVVKKKNEEVEASKVAASGWESESLDDNQSPIAPQPTPVASTKKSVKLPRRKCLSVGPVMLTPNSQVIRTILAEDREERYRYDVAPPSAENDECVHVVVDGHD